MKAVYIKAFGNADVLEIREVPDPPAPQGSEVIVRVRAAGLNRADLLQRRGFYPAPAGYSQEIPGLEFAGEIAETGPDVTEWNKGDRVFGITAGAAQAEYLLTRADQLARIPDGISFTDAAAIPEAFITAHDAIFTQGKLQTGETLLVHAVGSGVGLAALQIAKAKGIRVFGTSRTSSKLEAAREFGLDDALLAGEGANFAAIIADKTGGKGVDVILDLVGAGYFLQNLESLAMKGRLMLVGLTAGTKTELDLGLALRKRLQIIGTTLRGRSLEEKAEATKRFADEVIPLIEQGKVRPNVDKVFAFDDVRAAHEYLESNESFGKVVLSL